MFAEATDSGSRHGDSHRELQKVAGLVMSGDDILLFEIVAWVDSFG